MLKNEKILITGGTGSLGRALIKELVQNNKIVVYSRNEERQFNVQKEISNKNVEFFIGDVRDQKTLEMALHGCTIAIHAAAMKDLIMCESQPTQTVLNNITGSISFINAVKNSKIKRAVAVSTDKSASPSNVYGCSKYIMEKLFEEANRFSEVIFSSVRFGNMIDSTGSLISYWKKNPNIEIKLTHPDIARFFFTIKDGAETVLKALNAAQGGEIYIKKMKKAKIFNILRIITGKNKFDIMGLFPGEKIHEVLLSPTEVDYCFEEGDFYVIKSGAVNKKPPTLFTTENAIEFSEDELKELIANC